MVTQIISSIYLKQKEQFFFYQNQFIRLFFKTEIYFNIKKKNNEQEQVNLNECIVCEVKQDASLLHIIYSSFKMSVHETFVT